MSQSIVALAARQQGGALEPLRLEREPLAPDQVDIAVEYCGVCHSDLSMIDNEWGAASYPLVPGHEVIGTISAVGAQVDHLRLGQRVGLGWFASSCLHCLSCSAGDHHLCGNNVGTIVGRHGGFASHVRAQWRWAIPLPEGMSAAHSGPLFCGGITVFAPMVEFGLHPMHRIGVVGIGGLGHLAIKFARAFGCEVVAFTSTPAKRAEALAMGAHEAVASNDSKAIKAQRDRFDFMLVTVNVPLDWNALLAALRPRGRLHFVGAVLEPIAVPAFALIGGQKSVSGSPLGSPAVTAKMLEFCQRHQILPTIESFAMSDAQRAMEHVRAGQARYRVVLRQDLQT